MSIIEQIRAEIEWRKKKNQIGNTQYWEGAFYEDCAILSFLSTLQEQPVCEGCAMLLNGVCIHPEGKCNKLTEQPVREETIYTLNGLMQQFIKEGENDAEQERRARAYKAFFDAMDYEPEPVCEELEDAARAYVDDTNPADSFYDAFIAGANWQKEKDAKRWEEEGTTFVPLSVHEEAKQRSYEEGKKDMCEQMMKEAVETWMLEGSMFEPEFIKRKVIIIKEDKQ